ncbi:MAG: hypothetical protein DCC75_05805 [Proteobacteria bacterium]|nr:MAG: hypothetical protein DCC75_05805 [Pseudomonadota bacterium]
MKSKVVSKMRIVTASLMLFSCAAVLQQGVLINTAQAEIRATAKKSKKNSKKLVKTKNLLRKRGLKEVPTAQDTLKARGGGQSGQARAAALSGEPPALVDIAQSPIKEIFWEAGLVDAIIEGNPSQQQCGGFYHGFSDGESGGLGACHMAESVGYSYASILESQTSLCYMKNFPSEDNLNSGGVELVSGSLPNGDVTKIFAPPAGNEPRLVKVNIEGSPQGQEGEDQGPGGPETVFIKVAPQSQNSSSGHMYQVDLWFCADDSSEVYGYDRIKIRDDGRIETKNVSNQGGDSHSSSVLGFLTFADAEVSWDLTKNRTSKLQFASQGGGVFKSDVTITPQNLIKIKTLDNFGGSSSKRYSVTSFAGEGPESLNFLEGAFKENHGGDDNEDDIIGATEWRDDLYVSAPNNALINSLDGASYQDGFYQELPSGDYQIPSGFSCDAQPDIEINLDMSNEVLADSVAGCEPAFRDMHFCHDDEEVRAADQNYFEVCSF